MSSLILDLVLLTDALMIIVSDTHHKLPQTLVAGELIELPLSSLGCHSSLSSAKVLKGSCSWVVSAFRSRLHPSLAAAFVVFSQVPSALISCSHPPLRSLFTLLPHFPLSFFSSSELGLHLAPLTLLNVSTLSTM